MNPSRREFVRRMLAASILVGVGSFAIWDLLQVGQGPGQGPPVTLLQTTTQLASTQQSTTSSGQVQTSSQAAPSGYVLVAPVSALAGKTSAYFNHPTHGLSMLISLSGQWKAFSATCTHAPCTVQYGSSHIQCPCHGGTFDPSNGNVISGPPPTRLPEYGVVIQNGNLYVSNGVVN